MENELKYKVWSQISKYLQTLGKERFINEVIKDNKNDSYSLMSSKDRECYGS